MVDTHSYKLSPLGPALITYRDEIFYYHQQTFWIIPAVWWRIQCNFCQFLLYPKMKFRRIELVLVPSRMAVKNVYLLADVLSALDILGLGLASLASFTGGVAAGAVLVEDWGGGEGVEVPLASVWPLLLFEPCWCWTRLLLLDGPAPDVDMEQLMVWWDLQINLLKTNTIKSHENQSYHKAFQD